MKESKSFALPFMMEEAFKFLGRKFLCLVHFMVLLLLTNGEYSLLLPVFSPLAPSTSQAGLGNPAFLQTQK